MPPVQVQYQKHNFLRLSLYLWYKIYNYSEPYKIAFCECQHEKFRITTATEHSLCQNAVHRLKNNNKCDGVHKLTDNLSRFRCYIVKSDNGSASPSFPTMTVSVILTLMVIMLRKEIGMAITAIFL